MKCHPFFLAIAAATLLLADQATAYQIIIDYNTFKVRDGIDRTASFRCDGVWCILQNSDLSDAQWKTVFDHNGAGRVFAEDNPGPHNAGQAPAYNYDRARAIADHVDGALCYNETGSTPGGTLLSDDQITADAANHGGSVIVLTRGYSTNPADTWRQQTDRCLANPKVSGVAMETVLSYEQLVCDELVRTALNTYHKPVYFLLPSSNAAYVTESINYLKLRQPALMHDRRVFIVICPYQTPGTPWFGNDVSTAQGMIGLVKQLNP